MRSPTTTRALRLLFGVLAILALALQARPGYAESDQTAVVASSDGLHLRAAGNAGAAVLDTLASGTVVTLTGPAVAGWYPVQVNGETGWVDGDYLTLQSGASATTSQPAAGLTVGGNAVVTADALNVRRDASRAAAILGTVGAGTVVRVTAGPAADGWWQITGGGLAGYVFGAYLSPTAAGASGAQSSAVFDLDLPLTFHRQLTPIWCDPADLETWLDYHTGDSEAANYQIQQNFWNWELAHNDGFTVDQWDASPYAVASAAHHWMPSLGFNHFIYDDPMTAVRTMTWLIANPSYREPSIATIWRGDHYVIVRGVRAVGDPYKDYSSAKILGLYVMDPNQGRPSWLGTDTYIDIGTWLGVHFTPVTYLTPGAGVPGDVWQDKYVTIQRDWTTDGPTPGGRVDATPAQYGQ